MTGGSKEKGRQIKRTRVKELCSRWSGFRKRSAAGGCDSGGCLGGRKIWPGQLVCDSSDPEPEHE